MSPSKKKTTRHYRAINYKFNYSERIFPFILFNSKFVTNKNFQPRSSFTKSITPIRSTSFRIIESDLNLI